MKIVSLIAQYLMALLFILTGLNGFLNFLPAPPPDTEMQKQFLTVMVQSHYILPVMVVQLLAGLLFISNRFIPLALTIIAPVIVNILIFHALIAPKGIVPGVVVAVFWLIVFFRYRSAFAGILRARPRVG